MPPSGLRPTMIDMRVTARTCRVGRVPVADRLRDGRVQQFRRRGRHRKPLGFRALLAPSGALLGKRSRPG